MVPLSPVPPYSLPNKPYEIPKIRPWTLGLEQVDPGSGKSGPCEIPESGPWTLGPEKVDLGPDCFWQEDRIWTWP